MSTTGDTSKNDDSAPTVEIFRVYKSRWFVLLVVAALNCVNTLSWISFAPVANFVDDFYHQDGTTNILTVVFLAVSVPVGLLAMWTTGRFGIRSAILAASWFNGLGAILRLFSSLEFTGHSVRRPLVICGQSVAACAYPFIMFLPTKVAASWFPDSQRAKANSLATLANPLGVLLAMSLAPNLVQRSSDVLFLNLLTSVLGVLVCVAATLGVRTSQPPTPPTRGAAQRSTPFGQGVKKLMTSKSFLILLLSLGSGIGMFNALYGIMQQLLCSRGYSNNFAASCCALMIIGGFFGAFSSAFLVDKTKKFAEIMKLAFGLAVISGVVFSFCALKPNLAPAIGASCFVFGFFGLAAYPIGLEMAVECSFPVAETTSAGFIVLGGQILGTVYMIGMSSLRSELTGNDTLIETCTLRDSTIDPKTTTPLTILSTTVTTTIVAENVAKAYDMTLPMVVFCLTAALVVSFFILTFRPKLRRLKLESDQQQQQQGASNNLLTTKVEEKSLEQEMLDLSQLKEQKRREFLDST